MIGSVFAKRAVPNQAAPFLGADFFIFSKCLCGFDFSKTFMKHYLDTYFAKEMMPIERVAKHSKTKIGKAILKQNQRG